MTILHTCTSLILTNNTCMHTGKLLLSSHRSWGVYHWTSEKSNHSRCPSSSASICSHNSFCHYAIYIPRSHPPTLCFNITRPQLLWQLYVWPWLSVITPVTVKQELLHSSKHIHTFICGTLSPLAPVFLVWLQQRTCWHCVQLPVELITADCSLTDEKT